MLEKKSNIIQINWINKSDSFALVPGYYNKRKIRKIKELKKRKGNCFFSPRISHNLIDFIYRAVIQLNLKDKKLIFSRGAVKIKEKPVLHAVGIRELEWNAGTSIRIPHKLNYNFKIQLFIDNEEYKIRLMEIIVLSALLHITYSLKNSRWCTDMAVLIIAKGWGQLKKMTSK